MLKIEKYLDNLPIEVILNGEFCVTRIGEKQPFDPFKGHLISAKDTFYPIEKIAERELNGYDTLGLKAGNGISIIDIDECVDPKSGEIDPIAMEIINFMKSYTELSPSGKGIRILFKALNKFDIGKHRTKNSTIGFEYYDAEYQQERAGRMARLSGNKIMPFDFRAVDTSEILDKYMKRTHHVKKGNLDQDEARPEWVDLVYILLVTRSDMRNLFNREVFENYESESDLIICNTIAEYTDNANEIMEVFKRTRYYKTKGVKSGKKRHKEKWNSNYGWNVVNMAVPKEVKIRYRPRSENKSERENLIVVAERFGLLKRYYFRKHEIDWDKQITDEQVIDALYDLTNMKLARKNLRVELGGK
jgi:primase-polymerase (primpol)-like protein